MELKEFKAGRKEFRMAKDEAQVKKVLDVIAQFNKAGHAPSTRQISNVYMAVQTVDQALENADQSIPTQVQDSILQGFLNPLQHAKKLEATYGPRNQKYWKLPDEVISRITKAMAK